MSDPWDDASLPPKPADWVGPELGPVFVAAYETDSACCGDMIDAGDRARADGHGGWIHANGTCDATIEMTRAASPTVCSSCFCVHAGECL